MDKIKRIDCSPECGFGIQSYDEDEVINVTQKHVTEKHGQELSEDDIKASISEVEIL